jgi:alkyldihydroxyacetonephosphate synthase
MRGFAAWSMPSMSVGWDTMRDMFQSGLRPAVLRLYDPFDSMLAQQSRSRRRDKASRLRSDETKGPGRGVAALRSLLARPQLFNDLLDSSLASRALGGALLVAIFDGQDDGDAVFSDVARARAIAERAGGRYEGEGPARKWLLHRYSVSYRQSPLFAQGMFVDTMEVAATWSRIGALYDGVRVAIGKSAFVMAHLSHAYPDGCCIYFSFAGVAKPRSSAEWDAASEARYDEIWHAALGAALAAGGTLAHHHGVGRSKAPRLGEDLGSGLDVQRALKRAFDPHGVLNPGALLPPVTPNPFAPDIDARGSDL